MSAGEMTPDEMETIAGEFFDIFVRHDTSKADALTVMVGVLGSMIASLADSPENLAKNLDTINRALAVNAQAAYRKNLS